MKSAFFATWRGPPLAVEFMAGFEHRSGSKWRTVELTSREAVGVDGATLFVPDLAELELLLRAFGRPKDLDRAEALAMRVSRQVRRTTQERRDPPDDQR